MGDRRQRLSEVWNAPEDARLVFVQQRRGASLCLRDAMCNHQGVEQGDLPRCIRKAQQVEDVVKVLHALESDGEFLRYQFTGCATFQEAAAWMHNEGCKRALLAIHCHDVQTTGESKPFNHFVVLHAHHGRVFLLDSKKASTNEVNNSLDTSAYDMSRFDYYTTPYHRHDPIVAHILECAAEAPH